MAIRFTLNCSLIGMLFLLLVSCSNRQPMQIMDEYEIPFTADRNIRYLYLRSPTNDTIQLDFFVTYEDGIKHVVEENLKNGQRQSTRKFRVTSRGKELIDEVVYFTDMAAAGETQSVHANILEYVNTDDATPYAGGSYEKGFRTKESIIVNIKTKETFSGEETFSFNGRDIPSLKFESRNTIRTYFQFVPFVWTSSEHNGYVIYSKGVGLTYVWLDTPEGEIAETLIGMEYFETPDL